MTKPDAGEQHESKREIEIAVDEGWKDEVRRENEQLEAEYQSKKAGETSPAGPTAETHEPRPAPDSGSSEYAPMPPPSFASLMSMLSTQAMIGLGAFADPNDESSGPHLELAKHFIDLLALLETKTAGNLSADESRQLAGTLHELRMAYVEVSRQQSAAKAPQ